MRFHLARPPRLTKSTVLRFAVIILAIVTCIALPLGLRHVSAAPSSAHLITDSQAASDITSLDDSHAEPPQGALHGDFIIVCPNTPEGGLDVSQVDPILFPNGTAPHNHLFFGNESVTPASTDAQLEGLNGNPTPATTCQDSEDTGAEWAPALYYNPTGGPVTNQNLWTQDASGKKVYVRVYYVESVPSDTSIDPNGYSDEQFVPDGLQMVAGFPAATGPTCWICTDPATGNTLDDSEHQVMWDCGANNTFATQMSAWPYNCNYNSQQQFDGLVAHIMFPACWDGKGLATQDQSVSGPGKGVGGLPIFFSPTIPGSGSNDLKYEDLNNAKCPTGYQYIPRISVRVHTLITNPCPEYPSSDWQDCLPGGMNCAASITNCTPGSSQCTPTLCTPAFQDLETHTGLPMTPPNIQLMVSMGMNGNPPMPGPWWTMHADYWNTWQQGSITPNNQPGNGTLDDNVDYCLRPDRQYTYTTIHGMPCSFISDGEYPPMNQN